MQIIDPNLMRHTARHQQAVTSAEREALNLHRARRRARLAGLVARLGKTLMRAGAALRPALSSRV